jgi:serine/threonine-protein kinase
MTAADDASLGGSRLERVFEEALDLPATERRSFVENACADDPTLSSRVLAMLAAHEEETGPLDVPLSLLMGPLLDADDEGGLEANAARAVRETETAEGARIGPYRIVRRIGRGGMGSVYLADRADGAYEQRVALKVVNAGIVTEELERRFLRERQILARLDHPGIARLLHGGLTPAGHPYLAMELVDGKPITEWAASHGGGLPARVSLFLQVLDAVEYAHGRLVVHRDLKPSNILVTPHGRVRLLDFGIARLLAADGEDDLETRTGLLLLTPEYAAPELLRGETVTTRTDVYALGVVLYEVLTGRRPFELGTGSLMEMLRVAERDPPPPSRAPGLAPGLRKRLEGDLDAVVGMALRREPERRYPSVEAFADDLRAYLDRRPVAARPDTRAYRVRRFVRRHAVGVAATAAVLVSLLGGLLGTTRMAASARLEAARSDAVRAFLFSLWEGADPDRHGGEVPTALDLVDRGAERVDSLAADAGPEVRVDMLTTLGFLYGKLGAYERAVGMFDSAVDAARSAFGTDDRTGAALDGLAQNLLAVGRLDEAETAVQESVEIRRAAGSPDMALAGSYSTLGAVLRLRGRFDEARTAHLSAIELDRRAAGDTSRAVAIDLNNLGHLAGQTGDFEEAERHLREAVAIHRAVEGGRPNLATALGNLASVRRELGDLEEAEALERETLEIRTTVLGPEHPDVAISLNQLGLTLQDAGRYDEADSLLLLSAEMRRRTFGEDHPETVRTLNNLATVRFRRGAYGRAAEAQEGVVAAARASDPTLSSSATLTMLHNLGVMRLRAGDLVGAEAPLAEAEAGRRRLLGDDHPDVASSWRWISELRRLQGRLPEAEALGREALARFEEVFPPGHARLAEARICIGAALVEGGRSAEGLPFLRAALEAREASFPEGGLPVAEARVWLGTALVQTGEPEEGRSLLAAALADYQAAKREGEPEAERARRELAGG